MSREVLELFHRMIARVYVGLGQSQGKTLLPLPPSDMLVAPPAVVPAPTRASPPPRPSCRALSSELLQNGVACYRTQPFLLQK